MNPEGKDATSVPREMRDAEFIFVNEAARLLGCSISTVERRCEEGRLRAWRATSRGWWRIDADSIHELLKGRHEEWVSAGTAARILSVSHATIGRLCAEERLRAWRLSDRGWWKIGLASVRTLKNSQLSAFSTGRGKIGSLKPKMGENY